MKNATKHADDLKSLFRKLLKEYKPQPLEKQEPLKALVRGAMSYDASDAKANEAVKRIEKEFVDLNELRVATELEVHDFLGERYPDLEQRVTMVTQALNAIFEREHTMNLQRLETISKRDARQFLKDLPQMHPFVEAYVMLHCFDGHCVPVDTTIYEYLQEKGIVEEGATQDELQKFLEHQLKAEECYDFYSSVRAAAFDAEGRKKKK